MKLEDYSKNEWHDFSQYSYISSTYFHLIHEASTPEKYKQRHRAWLETALASFYNNASSENVLSFWSQSMDQIVAILQKEADLQDEALDLVALGKYGSEVLNLSSDIDILLISNKMTDALIHKTRKFIKLINQKTEWGFISRADLDLKPPILNDRFIINPQMLINYLWDSKELWERLAYTRSRRIFFSIENQEEDYMSVVKKFCYRKYVNMGLIEDLASLLKKILINNHDIHNLKLCAGGIRSVELFLSSLQLLYGGRDEDLQTSHTYKLFKTAQVKSYIRNEDLSTLKNNYDLLRRCENLIQMQTDSQDHSVNERLPLSYKSIQSACSQNTEIIMSFINEVIGHQKTPRLSHAPSLEEFDTEKFPHLRNFEQFLTRRPSYKNLILSHPKSFKNFINALKYSPYLSRILVLRPDLFDLYLIKKTIIDLNADDEMLLTQLVDFKLLNYITGLGDFLIHFDVDNLTSVLSLTSDKCLSVLLQKVFPHSNDIRILKLGKWASHEVGLKSDLDFIFVCDDDDIDLKKIRKVIHYIGHHTFHGPFYSIDLRLRPSGTAGPMVTTTQKLKEYIESPDTSAWVKQSYLRNAFLDTAEKMIFDYSHAPLTEEQKTELLEIREKRMFKINDHYLSPKETQGGLIDLEFFLQHICLVNQYYPNSNSFENILLELWDKKMIPTKILSPILDIYRYLRTTEQISSLKFSTHDLRITPDNAKFVFDLPDSSHKFFKIPPSFTQLKETLEQSKALIEEHHPFLL